MPSQRSHSCAACGRKNVRTLCELAEEKESVVRAVRTIVRYSAGQVIFYQGQPPFAIYCLGSGAAKIYKSSEGGGRIIIRVLGAGEIIGYRAVLANEPYAATAEAIKPTTACVITRESFLEILRVSPGLCERLLAKMARELRISEEQLLTIANEPVRRRVARLLLLMLKAGGTPMRANSRIPTVYRRNEMAQMIGTTPETLSRMLRLMTSQGLIRVTRSEIRVTDPPRLAAAGRPETVT
jgi:CRP/FNR family transcriptional regulator